LPTLTSNLNPPDSASQVARIIQHLAHLSFEGGKNGRIKDKANLGKNANTLFEK
jgi:hypothetical protein